MTAMVRAPAASGVTALAPLRGQAAARLEQSRSSTGAGAWLERCDYCGCSRHACGCEERFEYEQIRDNPTLIERSL